MHAKYEVVKLISGYGIARRPHGEIEGVYDSYVEAERAACEMSGRGSDAVALSDRVPLSINQSPT
jgi:hypothetical protein